MGVSFRPNEHRYVSAISKVLSPSLLRDFDNIRLREKLMKIEIFNVEHICGNMAVSRAR